jgi:transketolase
VTIIAVGGGLAYGSQGYTHHGVEDLGIMAMLPNMVVVCPADPHEAVSLLPQLLDRGRPGYLRLGRSGEPVLHARDTPIVLDRMIWMRRGTDIALLACGPILGRALAAAEALTARGISASVASVPGFQPLDQEAVCEAARQHRAILTIEEHSVMGGLGTRVADILLSAGLAPTFGKYGITDVLRGQIGSQAWLLDQLGSIEDRAEALL